MTSADQWLKSEKKYGKVPQPEAIQNYNKSVGFVDQLDQNVSTYRAHMHQRKWFWPILCYVFSVANLQSTMPVF